MHSKAGFARQGHCRANYLCYRMGKSYPAEAGAVFQGCLVSLLFNPWAVCKPNIYLKYFQFWQYPFFRFLFSNVNIKYTIGKFKKIKCICQYSYIDKKAFVFIIHWFFLTFYSLFQKFTKYKQITKIQNAMVANSN